MIRILRYARGDHGPLKANAAHEFARDYTMCHYASDTVFTFIPKNGCTTLRYALARANGAIEGPGDFDWIHRNNHSFAATTRDLARARYSFVVLRDIHARLASAFIDKLIPEAPGEKTPAMWSLAKAARLPARDLGAVSFRSFCARLAEEEVLRGDVHWRPQVDFLVYEDYDDWFRLERFDAACARISRHTGMEIVDTRALSGHGSDRLELLAGPGFADMPLDELAGLKARGQAPAHGALYEDDLHRVVAALYADDAALLAARFGSLAT